MDTFNYTTSTKLKDLIASYEQVVHSEWCWEEAKNRIMDEINKKYMAEYMKDKQWDARKFQTANYTYEWNWTSLIENKKVKES
jgi:hypothetical protein